MLVLIKVKRVYLFNDTIRTRAATEMICGNELFLLIEDIYGMCCQGNGMRK